MNKILKEKLMESLSSVLPITVIVLLLSVTVAPMPVGTLTLFLTGAVLFTIAEPDLQVLAEQVPSIPNAMLIWTVAAGVGLFFVIAMLRTLFKIRLANLLIMFYIGVFVLSIFVPNEFVSVAFDSGGVTTGPITVPFIMALGIGLASIRGDRDAQDDSFGLVALCSIGPILAVLLLGIFYRGGDPSYTPVTVPEVQDTQQVALVFLHDLPEYIKEVCSALFPIIIFCAIFQLVFRRFRRLQLQKIGVGFIYTFVGLALFLTGVNVGFMPAGHFLGQQLAGGGRTRSTCSEQTGRDDYKRRGIPARYDAEPFHRRGLLGRHVHAACADRAVDLLDFGAGLYGRTGADLSGTQNIHRYRVRLRRRGLRTDDDDLSAAVCNGRL